MSSATVIETPRSLRSFEALYGSRVAIVGAGFLGTTLALRYAQAGRIVTLFDSQEQLERRGHRPVASSDRLLLSLIDELGLSGEIRWSTDWSFGRRFGLLPGGHSRILDALRECACRLGVQVRLGTPVRAVHGDGGLVVELDGESLDFHEVILTVPSHVAAELVVNLADEERSALTRVGYVGIVSVSFMLERPLGRRYLSRIERGGDMFTLVDPAALERRDSAPSAVYVSRPVAANDEFFSANDHAVIDRFARALPGDATIADARVVRTPSAFTLDRLASFNSSIGGLSIVNSAHLGLGRHHFERTAALAQSAYRTLCAERIF